MSFIPDGENGTTRRGFVTGAAGMAVAATIASAFMPAKAAALNPEEQPASPPANGSKYRKYFSNELTPEEREKGYGTQNMFLVYSDDDLIEGSQFFTALMMGESATKIAGHGPHIHPWPEILIAVGTDPEHPHELGGEFELFMGEEMEKHVIDKPAFIYIPARLVHCPFTVTKVTRPFLFITTQYGGKHAEMPRRDLVPKDMVDKYIFIDGEDGMQTDVYIPPAKRVKRKMPAALK